MFDVSGNSVKNLASLLILNEYVVPTRYIVVLGASMFGFSKVSNLSVSVDYEVIREGGVNDYVYALPKPSTDVQKLLFEKGYKIYDVIDRAGAEKWHDRAGAICIMDRNKTMVKALGFTSAYISKWELSDLSADQSTLLYEKVELIHNGLQELNIAKSAAMAALVKTGMEAAAAAGI